MVRFSKLICLTIMAGDLVFSQSTNPLQQFFIDLPQNFQSSGLPKPESLLNLEEQIASMSSQEVANALPAMISALKYPDEKVQAYAASAFYAVSLRSDSNELMKPYVIDIAGLFGKPGDRLHSLSALTLVNLRKVPPEALQPIISFLGRTDVAPSGQIGALAALLRLAPEDSQVLDSIVAFMSRPLDVDTRISTLNAIQSSRASDVRVSDSVAASLEDPHSGVQLAAIKALTRMGPETLIRVEPTLQALKEGTNEAPEVRVGAQRALRLIGK